MKARQIVWLYGLAGSGKSTLAKQLERDFGALIIDSDAFRFAWGDLGWSEAHKKLRARRLMEVAVRAAIVHPRVVVACITPHKESREFARSHGALLVHVDAPPDLCAKRKPELYERAVLLAGKDSVFENTSANVTCHTDKHGTPERQAVVVARWAGWLEP